MPLSYDQLFMVMFLHIVLYISQVFIFGRGGRGVRNLGGHQVKVHLHAS